MRATRQDACNLFRDGAIALAAAEANGVRVDVAYLKNTERELGERIEKIEHKLYQSEEWELMQKQYGAKANIDSGPQLGHVLFDILKNPNERKTKSGRWACDQKSLEAVQSKFTRRLLQRKKYDKLKNTYVAGFLRHVCEEFIHTSFNLNIARTFRSSANDPNLQNIPIRDPEVGKIIRSSMIPRRGRELCEVDFKGAEVCTAACYTKDQKLIYDILHGDMHRDMAMKLYQLKKSQVRKEVRFSAKSNFVFAEFYGAWFKTCARGLWDDIGKFNLTTADGIPLYDHLAELGITELGECDPDGEVEEGTFEAHVQAVENYFWNVRYKTYNQWKKDWYAKYLERGYFDMKTGFRCSGVMTRKECINYPIQGSSFHCLLWSLIQLNKWMIKKGLKSLIVGQIHDSILLDMVKKERDYVLEKVQRIITEDLPKAWPWIVVPLTVEMESSDKNWFEKSPVILAS